MKKTSFLFVFLLFGTGSLADVRDKRDALPAELVAKIAALPVDQQIEVLVSGPDTEATVALVELTRDGAVTLSNYDRLITNAVNVKGKINKPLLWKINRDFVPERDDRRLGILTRLAICIRDAPDGPERWRVLDRFLTYLDTIVTTSADSADRYDAYTLMNTVVWLSYNLIPCHGMDQLFSTTKRLRTDPNPRIKSYAETRLIYIGGLCGFKRQECEKLLLEHASSPEDKEQLRAKYQEYINWNGVQFNKEEDYRYAEAHAVEVVTDAALNSHYHPGLSYAISSILADHREADKYYDILLKLAILSNYERGGNKVLMGLARRTPVNASAEEKKRVDALLDAHENVFKSSGGYCVEALCAMLFKNDKTCRSGLDCIKCGALPKEPLYQQERILSMLFLALNSDHPGFSERTTAGLKIIAWIDAATAQKILAELKKWETEKGDAATTDWFKNALAEAQAAVDFYAQKTTTQKPPSASSQTPARP